MHSYFSDRSQAFHYASYKIFVAEVASTTNELLLHHHLMENAPDDSIRAYLLNHLADEVRGTVFRQTMFAEFERDMSALSEAGTPLTADLLSEKYFALMPGITATPSGRMTGSAGSGRAFRISIMISMSINMRPVFPPPSHCRKRFLPERSSPTWDS